MRNMTHSLQYFSISNKDYIGEKVMLNYYGQITGQKCQKLCCHFIGKWFNMKNNIIYNTATATEFVAPSWP